MILDEIVASRRSRRRSASAARPRGPRRSLAARLQPGALPAVIAEHKRCSPSAGAIGPPGRSLVSVVQSYERHGAAALSVLTNAEFFGAMPDDLWQARTSTTLPVLRKEFLLDEADVVESLQLGADAILLIARILPGAQLGELYRVARSLDLEVLVEVHSLAEAERALIAGAVMLGINHRDLDTLRVDLSLSQRIRAALRPPPDVLFVGESGLRTTADLERMRQHRMDAVLIGESLLAAPDPGVALAKLLGSAH